MALPTFPEELRTPTDFRPPKEAPQQPVLLEDYADLEDILNAADREAILDVPAENEIDALQGRANLVRETVIAERLWLLGYLKDAKDVASSPRASKRDSFLSAVASFQRGAGLAVDKWSGVQTWQALQELVTFEVPTNVAGYSKGDRPLPALVRAARLRLWSLGLVARKPTQKLSSEAIPNNELEQFWSLCGRFKLVALGDPQPPLLELIGQLFDQDRLLGAVAAAGKLANIGGRDRWVFSYVKRTTERRGETDPEVESFLACLAKIELWLLGFDVDISYNRNYPVYLFKKSVTKRNRKIETALTQFWNQFGQDKEMFDRDPERSERRRKRRDRQRLEEFITPELFKALADPELSGRLADPGADAPAPAGLVRDEYSREVTEELKTQDQIETTWTRGRSLGMRLWDGARRLWQWIRRGLAKILKIGRNLVRAFFRYSMKAFEIARLTMKTVAASVGQYAKGEIETETSVQLLLARDGDVRACVPADVSPKDLMLASHRLRYFGSAFHLSCRVLATILRIIRTAVTGAIGWARLLWLLVRSYRDIRPLYKELRALPHPAAA